MKQFAQQCAIEILNPYEESTLGYIKNKGKPFLNISESKYLNNSWETVNNIVIPPDCVDELLEIVDVIKSQLKNYKKEVEQD